MTTVVGTVPRLPGFLQWVAAPIAAERLAAWRIGVGLVLLLDAILFYCPMLRGQLYGPTSLEGPGVFAERFAAPHWNWSLLNWLPVEWGATVLVSVWIVCASLLLIGWRPNVAAAVAWAISLSFYNSNFYLHNSGDRLRHFVLLLLIFAKTDAAWAWRRRPREGAWPVLVSGWPMRVMLLQMALMYFMNGVYKLQGRIWWEGSVMWYVNHDLAWARWSSPWMPYWVTAALTWFALVWEVGFPVWLTLPRLRTIALLIGVAFHVFTFFHLEIAAFPLWALCLYLPLLPIREAATRRVSGEER